jgi:hypothetical protein
VPSLGRREIGVPLMTTPRGIAELEQRIHAKLPRIVCDVFEVDPSKYIVSVASARLSSDRKQLKVVLALRFLPGRSYCCMEPGCHLPTYDATRTAEVGMQLAKAVGLPKSVEFHIEDVNPLIEGARFSTRDQ